MKEDVKEILLTAEEIQAKCAELGKQITQDYKGKELLLVSVLKGGVVVFSDLIRPIALARLIAFLVVGSYGKGGKTSGNVKVIKDLDINVADKDILIIEDILDSGITLQHLTVLLNARNPKSIRICTLLDKPERRMADIHSDYVGFVVPDEFLIGYGLDYAEKYRNLPYVGTLDPKVYE